MHTQNTNAHTYKHIYQHTTHINIKTTHIHINTDTCKYTHTYKLTHKYTHMHTHICVCTHTHQSGKGFCGKKMNFSGKRKEMREEKSLCTNTYMHEIAKVQKVSIKTV